MGHLAIVMSGRGGEGKTLLTHLLAEYLVEGGADWTIATSAPRPAAVYPSDERLVHAFDVNSTRAQVRFVDLVLRAPEAWTLLDLAHVDNERFIRFCDETGAIGELATLGVRTLCFRLFSVSVRDVRERFWPESLIDGTDILVLNRLSPTQAEEWQRDPFRQELLAANVPEINLPRMDESAVRHFLGLRRFLHDYIADRSGSGQDVFARIHLAKLAHAFQAQLGQFLLTRDLRRLDDPLFR